LQQNFHFFSIIFKDN